MKKWTKVQSRDDGFTKVYTPECTVGDIINRVWVIDGRQVMLTSANDETRVMYGHELETLTPVEYDYYRVSVCVYGLADQGKLYVER